MIAELNEAEACLTFGPCNLGAQESGAEKVNLEYKFSFSDVSCTILGGFLLQYVNFCLFVFLYTK